MIIPFPGGLRQKIDRFYRLTEAIEMEQAMEALADPALITETEALSLPEDRELAVSYLQAVGHVLRVARHSENAASEELKQVLYSACALSDQVEEERDIWYFTALVLRESGETAESLRHVEHYLAGEDFPMRRKDRIIAMAECLSSELSMELGDAASAQHSHDEARNSVAQLKKSNQLGMGDFYPMHCCALSDGAKKAGDLDSAIAYLSEGISEWETDPDSNSFGALLLSEECAKLGYLHVQREAWIESAEAFAKAMKYNETPFVQTIPGARRSAADCGFNAGVSYLRENQYQQALPVLRAALRHYRSLQADSEADLASQIYRTCRALDLAAWETGQREEAILRCREGLLAVRGDASADEQTLCAALSALADRLAETGCLEEAVLLLEERLEIRERKSLYVPPFQLALDLSELARRHSLLGQTLVQQGNTAKAESSLRLAWERMRQAAVLDHKYLPRAEQMIKELLGFLRAQGRENELDSVRLEYADLVNQTDS